MNIDLNPLAGLKPVLEFGDHLIDHITEDKTKAAAAKTKLRVAAANGDFNLLMGQLSVDKVEAAHKSLFVAGWRPFVGWVLALSVFYDNLVAPPLGWDVTDPWQSFGLLAALLGVHVTRGAEKIMGAAREK